MNLRDMFITAIVLGVLPLALKHPWIGINLWTWLSVMNPHKFTWGFAYNAPFAALAAGVTLIGLFVTKDRVRLPADKVVIILIVFFCWMLLTTWTAIDPVRSMVQLNKVWKIQLMTLVAIAVLQNRRHLQVFVWVNVLSLAFFGVKGGLFTLQRGGVERVWGPPGGFIEGNNELALALVMAIPLMYFLRSQESRRWLRNVLLGMMLLTAISVLGTQSRGALLAIVAMATVLWWRSTNRFSTLLPILLVGVLLFAFMPESWFDRMQTIQNYEEDGSAMGRINAWWTMFHIANDRIMGAGFMAYTREIYNLYAPDPSRVLVAHSIYFQVLGEHGWPGLFLFLLVWLAGWRLASQIRGRAAADDEQRWLATLAGMCQVSLVGYAIGGAFLSLAYFDLPYNILVMLVVARRLLMQPQDAAVRTKAGAGSLFLRAGHGRRDRRIEHETP